MIYSITYRQICVAESILGFRVIDFGGKKIICGDGLEFINFTNYTVKKTDVFLGKDQALITGLTCSSKNSVNMFMPLKINLSFIWTYGSVIHWLSLTLILYKYESNTQSTY